MISHYVLLGVAAFASVWLAFRSKSVREALLLRPVSVEHPIPKAPSQLVRFQTVRLGEIQDKTTSKPRFLLALLLFVVLALLLKLIWLPTSGWPHYLQSMFLILLFGIGAGGETSSIMALMLLIGAPYFFARWMNWSPTATGLLMGAIVGGNAGTFLFRNYVNIFQTKLLEIREQANAEGEPLAGAAVFLRRLYLGSLALVPFTLLQQLVVFFWPSATFTPSFTSNEFWAQSLLLVVSMTLGLNLVFFTAPLFREMLERTSLSVAGDFTGYVVALKKENALEGEGGSAIEATSLTGTDPVEQSILKAMTIRPEWSVGDVKARINEHLDESGAWQSFQRQQVFPILLAVVYLVTNTVGQTLGSLFKFQMIVAEDAWVSLLVSIADGFAFWANLAFLIGLLTFWLRWLALWLSRFSGEPAPEQEVQAQNTETLWRLSRKSGVSYYCYNQGTEPTLVPAETSFPPKDASS